MKSLLLLLSIFYIILSLNLFCEDIYLKDGKIYKNVKIIKEFQGSVVIQINDKEIAIAKSFILKIEQIAFNDSFKSTIIDTVKIKENENNIIQSKDNPCNDKLFLSLQQKETLTKEEVQAYVELKKMCEESKKKSLLQNSNNELSKQTIKEYPRLPLLTVGCLGFIGAYHFIKKASDKSDAINALNGLKGLIPNTKIDTDELENDRDWAIIGGVVCGVAGVVFSIVALQSVEVKISQNQISLSYNF
ncbi:MAG: hypothetical protein NTX22_13175 [Ignavibacteriales bacterium]|nr:hypothetical protein [Ignavibacteriales bacterium]